jgi:hypothetical protein
VYQQAISPDSPFGLIGLLDRDLFQNFYLDEWPTLAWPCGFDVAPETLYEPATGKSPWQADNVCKVISSLDEWNGVSVPA